MEQHSENQSGSAPTPQRGSCHCGAVRYAANLDVRAGATMCNCTICTKLGARGGIVKPDAFELLEGGEHVHTYVWGHKISQRFFCKHCGVYCFARGNLPELGGEYVSINYNTLDDVDVGTLKLGHWDGRHD